MSVARQDEPNDTAARAPNTVGARFSRGMRLRRRRDFLFVQRVGVRGSANALVVILRPTKLGRGRVGLTVSKKVGKAHERNLLKRRLRHLLRTHPAAFQARDAIVIVRPGATELSFAALGRALWAAFAKAEEALAHRPGAGQRRTRGRRGAAAAAPPSAPKPSSSR